MSVKRHMLRSAFLLAVLAAVLFSSVIVRADDKKVINLYSSGDTNITDWLQNIVIPAFEKDFPQYKVNFINSRAAGDKPIVDRAVAALQTKSDPQVEVMDLDPRDFKDSIDAGLWYKPTVDDIPNLKNVIKAAVITEYGASYRGSQVLLAYNSAVIKDADVPKTFPDLIEWIKKNPGQFVYCRPDKGGSGGNFVVRALYEVSGKKPELFKTFDQKLADQYLPKTWDLLKSIHPYIYDKGAYPAGNKPVLKLFTDGAVSLITAWSDQAIEGLNKGQLPETTKLTQFTDLPLPGSYTTLVIPKNAANLKGAQDFVNWMISAKGQESVVKEIGGFPAIGWDQLPKELQQKYTSVITDNVPLWTGAEYSPLVTKGWYENVAPNIDPKS